MFALICVKKTGQCLLFFVFCFCKSHSPCRKKMLFKQMTKQLRLKLVQFVAQQSNILKQNANTTKTKKEPTTEMQNKD